MRRAHRVSFTPTLDTAAYAAGDQMSTLQSPAFLDPLYGAELTHVTVVDGASQSDPIDLFFFDRSVTVAADNAAAAFSDADMAFCLGVVNILASDYDSGGANNTIATVGLTVPMALSANNRGRNIYIALVQRGDGDYDANSLVFTLHGVRDDGG